MLVLRALLKLLMLLVDMLAALLLVLRALPTLLVALLMPLATLALLTVSSSPGLLRPLLPPCKLPASCLE